MFPTPYEVAHTTFSVVGENALGQRVTEKVTRQRPVYGWHPAKSGDGAAAALAGQVTTEVHLLMPEPDWRDGDTVTLPDGREFTVVGDVEDFNTGPFAAGLVFGYRARLRRVHNEPS